ncbi:thrombospondin type 3 repeat-containing protein [Candidatus Woesearchaeota archaeon]|nr:thrombospondin type 3 repeat-containing protein [Candidatus Woesearchaeota archaeon]
MRRNIQKKLVFFLFVFCLFAFSSLIVSAIKLTCPAQVEDKKCGQIGNVIKYSRESIYSDKCYKCGPSTDCSQVLVENPGKNKDCVFTAMGKDYNWYILQMPFRQAEHASRCKTDPLYQEFFYDYATPLNPPCKDYVTKEPGDENQQKTIVQDIENLFTPKLVDDTICKNSETRYERLDITSYDCFKCGDSTNKKKILVYGPERKNCVFAVFIDDGEKIEYELELEIDKNYQEKRCEKDPLYNEFMDCGTDKVFDFDKDDIPDNEDNCDRTDEKYKGSVSNDKNSPLYGCACADLCDTPDCVEETENAKSNPCLEVSNPDNDCKISISDNEGCIDECEGEDEDCKCPEGYSVIGDVCGRYIQRYVNGKHTCMWIEDSIFCEAMGYEPDTDPETALPSTISEECSKYSHEDCEGRWIKIDGTCVWSCYDSPTKECSIVDTSNCPPLPEGCEEAEWTCSIKGQCQLQANDEELIKKCISPDYCPDDMLECGLLGCHCKTGAPKYECSSPGGCINKGENPYGCEGGWTCINHICIWEYEDECDCPGLFTEQGYIEACGEHECTPNWKIEGWSDCIDGKKTPIYNDENECGNNDTKPRAIEVKCEGSEDDEQEDEQNSEECLIGLHRSSYNAADCLMFGTKEEECVEDPIANECMCLYDVPGEGSFSCATDLLMQACDKTCTNCKTEYKRPKGYNSATCQKRSPETFCEWADADIKECYEYEKKLSKEKKQGSFSCVNDQIYQQIAEECTNCQKELGRDKYNGMKCFVKDPESYCVYRETNPCDCFSDGGSLTCSKDPLWNMCSGECKVTECSEGYHRDYFNSDKCGTFILKDNKCVFKEIKESLNCLGIEGTDSCIDDPIKQMSESCMDSCPESYKRSSYNANDCLEKSQKTGCAWKPAELDKCIKVDGSGKCIEDPIYHRFSGKCEILDKDGDGIDDGFDNCPDTVKGSAADKNGCSCEQKKCDDSNPCTDDSCEAKTAQCIYKNDDSNICGSEKICKPDQCQANYPYHFIDYPESGHDFCSEGKCLEYTCNPISSSYSQKCNPDEDGDGDLDVTDCDDANPEIYTGAEEICDGLDNDCDGSADEDLTAPACSLQLGACAGSKKICSGYEGWLECASSNYGTNYVINEISPNHCDGLDNDCDGMIDEGCECTSGKDKKCGIDTGECVQGTQTCNKGQWGNCRNSIGPSYEICDGLDNDCDGLIDEDEFNRGDYTLNEECNIHSCPGIKICRVDGYSECMLENNPDEDGFCTEIDNCPNVYNPAQTDSDGDMIGDECDICAYDPINDIDSDGVCGNIDNCPNSYNPEQKDSDNDNQGDACDICPYDADNDIDFDNTCGDVDNCRERYNPEQNDCDNDGLGDACDFDSLCSTDSDRDGINDNEDNCVLNSNKNQHDSDGDGIGNICDMCPNDPFNDLDNDNVCDDIDNCRFISNQDQHDSDKDNIGDKCDLCIFDPLNDIDSDGICGNLDNCPDNFNPSQSDCDKDNRGDACDKNSACSSDSDNDGIVDLKDNCADYSNPLQKDSDKDKIGDACDFCPNDPFNDMDKDGICGDVDNCPGISNNNQLDSDLDGYGDMCDPCIFDPDNDIDNDGVCGNQKNLKDCSPGEECDNCPLKQNPGQKNCDNNLYGDACDFDSLCGADSDEDGIDDKRDNCPNKHNIGQLDRDGDGIGDICDICPGDPFNDLDNDGICGNIDNCPTFPNLNQIDSDNDLVGDLCDKCIFDPENDIDSDGICGDQDNCREKFNSLQNDCDNNMIGDICDYESECAKKLDNDNDGINNFEDICPEHADPEQKDSDNDGIGDSCDSCPKDKYNDVDCDGICGNIDNCPLTFNPGQHNSDLDIFGDDCDLCPNDQNNDMDEDGICNDQDNCPEIKNLDQEPCSIAGKEKEQFRDIISPALEQEDIVEIIQMSHGRLQTNLSPAEINQIVAEAKKDIRIEKKEETIAGRLFTRYKITIDSPESIENLAYYQNIPKCLVHEAEQIYFNGKNYDIVEKDPLIAWHFTSVNRSIELTYDVEGNISEECVDQLKDFAFMTKMESNKKQVVSKIILVPVLIVLFVISIVVILKKGKDTAKEKEAYDQVLLSKIEQIKKEYSTEDPEQIRKILEQQGTKEEFIEEIMKKL